jgi:hypothetical protein
LTCNSRIHTTTNFKRWHYYFWNENQLSRWFSKTVKRSFLRVANYFRDSIPNHSNVANPLYKIIDYSASKQAKLTWTEAGEKAFRDIKISKRYTLYLISDTAPILKSDPYDRRICLWSWGYLYQLIDVVKQLVTLVSKALKIVQLKWLVIQKEASAIYFCCTALGDQKFTILIDHKNLYVYKTRIKSCCCPNQKL